MTNYIARGRSIVMPLTNNSGGAVGKGDVVIVDTAGAGFTTTTTEKQTTEIVGVVMETIAAAADGRICVGGFVEVVNLNNSAGYGDFLYTDDVAKFGIASATLESGAFGQALDSGATPPAVLYIKPERFIDADPVWEAEGDILVGTGPNAAAILPIGSAGDVLTVSGGTATWAEVDALPGGGAEGDVLTIVGGDAAWAASASITWIGAPFLIGYSAASTYSVVTFVDAEGTGILIAGANPNIHEGVLLEDDCTTLTMTTLVCPRTGSLKLYAVFWIITQAAPNGAGNLYYSYDVQNMYNGRTGISDGSPGTYQTLACTDSQNSIVYDELTTVSVTEGDTITCRIIASRAHASDTVGSDLGIHILSLAGEYV